MKLSAVRPILVVLSLLVVSPSHGDQTKPKQKSTAQVQASQAHSQLTPLKLEWKDDPKAGEDSTGGSTLGAINGRKLQSSLTNPEVHQTERVTKIRQSRIPTKADDQAREELALTESTLTEEDPTTFQSFSKRAPASSVQVGQDPHFLEKLGNVDEGDGREDQTKNQGPSIPTSQVLNDVENARKTLEDVKEEKKAQKQQKLHVKTKLEIQEDRQEAAYKQAVLKASKAASKSGKPQYVQTPQGKVKVVFIEEKEFADNHSDGTSTEYKEAEKTRSRAPASVDDQIESIAQ